LAARDNCPDRFGFHVIITGLNIGFGLFPPNRLSLFFRKVVEWFNHITCENLLKSPVLAIDSGAEFCG
jgi:hypothetical protein